MRGLHRSATASPGSPGARRTGRVLLGCGIAGQLLFNGGYLVLGAITPGYSATRLSISSLSTTRYGGWQIANFLALGGLELLYATGMARTLTSGTGRRALPLMEAVIGGGLIAAGIWVTDSGSAATVHGRIHQAAATVVFGTRILDCLVLGARLRGQHRSQWAAGAVATALIMTVTLLLFSQSPPSASAGLYERIATVLPSTVVILFAAHLMRSGEAAAVAG